MNPRRDNQGRITHWDDDPRFPTPLPLTDWQYMVAMGSGIATGVCCMLLGGLAGKAATAWWGVHPGWFFLFVLVGGFVGLSALEAVSDAVAKRIGGADTNN